ncbi:hypothetical protein U1Q18_015966 [Sarracenia purpurea var. burkii]
MASLITASLSGAAIGTRGSINNLAMFQTPYIIGLPRSNDDLLRKKRGGRIGVESSRKGKVLVKAAATGESGGVAKFKGTQMRERKLTEMIEKKVKEAKEVCAADEKSAECKVAWDEVEEVSQAKADLRLKLQGNQDPLESFCRDNPETDECRIYEN